MTKLSDSQLMVLSSAAARDDGAAIVPEHLPKGAVIKVGSSLVRRKLMREMLTKPGMPGWRQDEQDRWISLIITRAGKDAISVEENESQRQGNDLDDVAASQSLSGPKPEDGGSPEGLSADPGDSGQHNHRADAPDTPREAGPASVPSNSNQTSPGSRPGSKKALVMDMLATGDGATIADLAQATGWLPHTTRAALTGLRKKGIVIERLQREGQRACAFRIASAARTAA